MKLRTEDICLAAMKQNGYALMFVPEALRTVAVCNAALGQDEDAFKYVPQHMQWVRAAREGHLLTVHFDCDCQVW